MMDRIKEVLKNDKVLHFICNFIIVLILGFIFNVIVGISAAVVASLGKELYDEIKYKGWSWNDLIADLIGIILGALIL